MTWFSCKVRLACLIEGVGLGRYMDSVIVFRARDFADAMGRAVALGKGREEEYVNADQQRVRWRCKEVVSLDILEPEELDGVEVYSEFVESDETVGFDAEFSPEASRPTQTL